jgi:ADP-heptose:LPS heptosyltransferase
LLANTSPETQARELLGYCLRGERWPDHLLDALRGSEALIRVVAEGLSDRFEPRLCDVYAELFSAAFGLGPEAAARYRRARVPRPIEPRPRRVVVLSRVTLGADVAIASVMLDAARSAFPEADIVLAGPRKNWELFGGDSRVAHLSVTYRRSDPLGHWPELRDRLSQPGTAVIDTDSRLTQLGLLPVCPEANYHFFESRGYGGDSPTTLGELAARWSEKVFGVPGRPFLALVESVDVGSAPVVAVSFGVGENPAKRVPDPFERQVLELIAGAGARIWIDKGAGAEEADRVERAAAAIPPRQVRFWEGSFAGFASIISQASLYVGYDSAGQHVAAACGVPLISVFAGFPAERMFQRWRPSGPGPIHVVRADHADPQRVLHELRGLLRGWKIPTG